MTADLDAVRAMLEGVSPGPWVSGWNGVCYQIDGKHDAICTDQFCYAPLAEEEANARFIAAARDLVPALAADLAATRAALAEAQGEVERLRGALTGLLEPFEDDPCRFDHHGYCQEHFIQPGEQCCVAIARQALKGPAK